MIHHGAYLKLLNLDERNAMFCIWGNDFVNNRQQVKKLLIQELEEIYTNHHSYLNLTKPIKAP